jgi:hypothetical protein
VTAPHLIDVPGTDWALWRSTCVRGAGFEAALVLRLGAPDAARSADSMLDALEAEARAHVAAVETFQAALREVPREDRARVKNEARRLYARRVPAPTGIASLDTASAVLAEHRGRADAARGELERVFTEANDRIAAAIRDVAGAPSFREAIAWQNRAALHTALAPLLASRHRRNAARRRNENLVASYLQRYCTKNDTIGFFGPIGWATWSEAEPALIARPGAQLVDHRTVHFEHWAVDALAAAIARDPGIEPELAPRCHAFVRIVGARVHSAVTGWHELPMRMHRLLAACSGTQSARTLAAELVGEHFADAAAVFDALRELRERQLIAWALEVPITWDGERRLRELVTAFTDDTVRARATAIIGELEAARDRVAATAGDAAALDDALAALEDTFGRVTGQAATRNLGAMYAARKPVFEDTRRDLDVVLGQAVLDALAAPLGLVLDSARWLTYEIARECSARLRRFHAAAGRSGERVPFADIWFPFQRSLYGTKDRPFDAPLAGLRERWTALLPLPVGARRVTFTADQLSDGVARAFAAPGPGWAEARYQAPDVMIAAAGIDAIARGQFELVLGELHVATNTIGMFGTEHPRPEELDAATLADLPDPRVIVIPQRDWPRAAVRNLPGFVAAKDYFLETGFEAAPGARDRILAMADLVVEDHGDDLVVCSTLGEPRFALLEFLGYVISNAIAAQRFTMLQPAAHQPRVAIDRLVIQRETWTFQPAQTGLEGGDSELDTFVAARRWARAHELPRFVYVKTALETKPVFVDLENPVYVRMLARLVRAAQTHVAGEVPVTVSEMVPAFDQLWLPGPHGETYTSELRIIAVDRRSNHPARSTATMRSSHV